MSELTAEQIRALASDLKNLHFTVHSLDRLKERGIFIQDIQNALKFGEIIEHYPNDYPFPSCLVFGLSCGEVFINGEVAARLEQIVAGFEKALTEIAVVNYTAA